MKKRLLAALLCLAMAVSLLPASALATSSVSTVPSGYTGIYTADDLDAVRNDLSGKYILMDNIDLSDWGDWKPLGAASFNSFTSGQFTGVFDGNGYSILNMTITDDTTTRNYKGNYWYAGLFSVIDGAEIKNITKITGTIYCESSPCLYAGGIVGWLQSGTIHDCTSYVDITYKNGEPGDGVVSTASGIGFAGGGIAGHIHKSSSSETNVLIYNCANFGDISGIGSGTPMNIGGIVGATFVTEDIEIYDCFNTGSLSAYTNFTDAGVGGIVGSGDRALIKRCYNVGRLSCKAGSSDRSYVGGIQGEGPGGYNVPLTISNCYYLSGVSAVGHIVYNTKTGETKTNVSAKACTTAQMQSQSTFSGFDFTNTWTMGGSSYPYPILQSSGSSSGTSSNSGCTTHTYTSAGGNVCTVCGYVFEPTLTAYNATLYVGNDGAAVRDQPYAKAGALVKILYKGSPVQVTHYLENALGNIWYMTSDGYYIYSERLTGTVSASYTITYNANGSNVSNMPTAQTQTSDTFKVSTTQPTREGYVFSGWALSASASKSAVAPGASLCVTDSLTLYAVWKKLSTVSAAVSDETKKKLDETAGFKQVKGSDGGGLCTSCATALMMRRRQIKDEYDIKYNLFDFYDVRMSFGLSRTSAENLTSATAYWTQKKGFSNWYSGDGNITFYTAGIAVSKIGTTVEKRKENIISLLADHPEGVVIYCKYSSGSHAILLTEYDYETDTFYACDSVDVRNAINGVKDQRFLYPVNLSETWLCKTVGGIDAVFANLTNSGSVCVWYISGASYE